MKFLHTADWHLGRQFEGHSLDADHAAVLDQILSALHAHKPDALVIAGDIFDRAAPPESAVRLFNTFIERVTAETGCAVVIIAGNHDSPDRIGAMAMLSDRKRALVRGPLSATEEPLILTDAHGPVAISALPFGYEYAARECFSNLEIKSPADVLAAEVAAAKPHIPDGARWIIVAHAFVTGATTTDTERPLTRAAGGIETVPADVFEGAHYVALGHIHRPQTAGAPHIRYAGSPLAFGFDEEGNEKSFAIVEIGADGRCAVELIPFRPLRTCRTLRGTFSEIIAQPASDDFLRVILTDEDRLVDPMKRLRERFPHACLLTYARDVTPLRPNAPAPNAASLNDPASLAADFISVMRGTPPSAEETRIIQTHIAELAAREDAA